MSRPRTALSVDGSVPSRGVGGLGAVRVIDSGALLLLLCAAANAACSPAFAHKPMPTAEGNRHRPVASRLAFSTASLPGMPVFGGRRAVIGSLLKLRGAAEHRGGEGVDRRGREENDMPRVSRRSMAAGEQQQVGRGGKKKKKRPQQQQQQQQQRSSSPAWTPERKRPRRVQKLEVARKVPPGMDGTSKTWNPMSAAHGVADRGLVGGNQETALLAGQIGKWQKLQASNKMEEAKIKCGLSIVPPKHAWGQIQAVRKGHDRHHARWMPHINLKYPVLLTEKQVEVLPRILADALRESPAFNVSLDSFGTFQHPTSSMLWARPGEGEYELRQLHYILSQILPETSTGSGEDDGEIYDVETFGLEYEPHLCLGQWTTMEEVSQAQQVISESWRPVSWEVGEIVLVTSGGGVASEAGGGRGDTSSGGSAGEFSLRSRVPLTKGKWTAFECPLEKPEPRLSKFQRYVELPLGYHAWNTGDASERDRLANLASSLLSAGADARGRASSPGRTQNSNATSGSSIINSSHAKANGAGEGGGGTAVNGVGGGGRGGDVVRGRWGGIRRVHDEDDAPSSYTHHPVADHEEGETWEGIGYEELYMASKGGNNLVSAEKGGEDRGGKETYRTPDVLRAPPLVEPIVGSPEERVITFADLPAKTSSSDEAGLFLGGRGGGGGYAKPTLEELIYELALSSLHGMKSRILPRSANVLMGKKMGKKIADGEVEWLRNLVDKRKAMVEAREKALNSKVVFNRKVAAAIGGETKGQVSLDQVRDYTWTSVIVEARREFFVNKLRLEAFDSEERQARRWSAAMARDVVQCLTIMGAEEMKGLISRREEWCRVKDVLQTQGSLRLDQSVVSLLEECDLDSSDPLAYDFVMSMTEYGGPDRGVGWDEHINSKREGAEFKMDINDGLPGWYVYYDMYGWC